MTVLNGGQMPYLSAILRIRSKVVVFALITMALLLSACGGGGSGGGVSNGGSDNGNGPTDGSSTSVYIASIDISDSDALIIASQQTSGDQLRNLENENPQILYRLTDDNLLIEVVFYDDEGNPLDWETYSPEYVEVVDGEYIYCRFASGNNLERRDFIVRKTDGRVFSINRPRFFRDVFGNLQYLVTSFDRTIADGSMYYLQDPEMNGGVTNLRKIDLSESANLTDARVSAVSDHVRGDTILADVIGNVLYNGKSLDPVLRLVKANGGIANLYPDIQWQVDAYQFHPKRTFYLDSDGKLAVLTRSTEEFRKVFCLVESDPDGAPIAPDTYSEGACTMPYDHSDLPISLYNQEGDRLDSFDGSYDCVYHGPNCGDFYDASGELFNPRRAPLYDSLGAPLNDPQWAVYTYVVYETKTLSIIVNSDFTHDIAETGLIHDEYWYPLSTGSISRQVFKGLVTANSDQNYFLPVGGKVIAIDYEKGVFTEVSNSTNSPHTIGSLARVVDQVYGAKATDQYYYVLGKSYDENKTVLLRIDSATHTPTELFEDGVFELYDFDVTADDDILFYALRLSDGALITGRVWMDGEIRVIEELIDQDISVLTTVH